MMSKKMMVELGFGLIVGIVLFINFVYGDPSPCNQAGTSPIFNVTFVHSSASWSMATHNSWKIQIAEDGLDYLETPHPCYDISFPCQIDVQANVLVSGLPSSIVDSYSQDLWLNEMCDHSFSRVALPYTSMIYHADVDEWIVSAGYFTTTEGCDNSTIVLNGVDPDYVTEMYYNPTPPAGGSAGYNHSQFMHELAHTCGLQHMPTNWNIICSGVCINAYDGSHGNPYPGIVAQGDSLDATQAYYLQTYTLGLQGPTPGAPYPGGTPYPGCNLWPTPYCVNPNATPCPTP